LCSRSRPHSVTNDMPKRSGICVYNMVGTSHRKCTCKSGDGSWLRHWELAAHQVRPAKCIVKGCPRPVRVGAHVKDGDHRVTPWIAPFCQYHNKRRATVRLALKPTSLLAAAAAIDCDQ
jgi:hypothetical protein